MRSLVLLLYSFCCFGVFAQVKPSILTFDDYYQIVKENHPVAMQANLQLEMGEANLQQARGGFDPKIQADLRQKYFEDKEYYEYGEGKLKIPTWFGIELEGGYKRNDGELLSAENSTPSAGLWFAGISVPIGEGLFIDERRTELRKAQSMIDQTEAERDLILNEVLFSAGVAYWEWFKAASSLSIYEQGLVLAQIRYDAVKRGAFLGDKPGIDTVEAGIQLQNRQLSLQEARLDLLNKRALLSIYLWQDGLIPLELDSLTIPESRETIVSNLDGIEIGGDVDSLLLNHPELRATSSKIEQLNFDRKWASEQLKPTLDLKYKPITEAIDNDPLAEYAIENYTWGFEFEFPIFLRKERGKLNLMKLKIRDSELGLDTKRQSLIYKFQAAKNDFEITREQIELYQITTKDYKRLLTGEQRLFDGGESYLFLVNYREVGYINAQIKLLELITKNQKAWLKTRYSLGDLN